MTDAFTTDPQQQVISLEDAMRFYRGGTIKAACPQCQSSNVEPIIDAVTGPVSQVHMRMRGGGYFPAVAYVCKNCGFITHYSWQHVRYWLDSNPG